MEPSNTPIEPGWLPKDAAAELLGVSVRQLENLAALGRIRKNRLTRQANERSARVLYSIEDLEAIKAGKPNLQEAPAPVPAALARIERAPFVFESDPFAGLAEKLAALARAFPTPAPVLKPWLTLTEASEWSGLPVHYLIAQARGGAAWARNVGQGSRARWRFNRDALASNCPSPATPEAS